MQSSNKHFLLPVCTLFVAAYATATCIQIELQNKKAGSYLPRKDFPSEGNPKWRAIVTTEKIWKMTRRPLKNDEIDYSPLTPDEQILLAQLNEQENNKNKLRGLINFRGLLQYPVALILMFASPLVWSCSTKVFFRATAVICISVALACLASALYRGYFASLGW